MNNQQSARAELLRDANFRWMMSGGMVSLLGDQFTLIALPWLVLMSTGDPLKMGLVIAIGSIPRAIFILVGGALADRYSPKSVLMLTKYVNMVLLGILAALVLTGHAGLPAICVLALGIGLASAFSVPAGTSMLPNVVAGPQLGMANGVMMSMRQITMLAGPLLAGLLFAVFGDGSAGAPGGAHGLAFAFGFDSLSFAVSAWTLAKVQLRPGPPKPPPAPVLQAVGEGLATVWSDAALRNLMLYWAACAFVVGGVMQVAMPVLANTRLGGASALGLVMGAHGAGTLLGMALSGALGKFRVGNLGTTVLLVDATLGLVLLPLGMVHTTWQAIALMVPAGALAGFMQVAVFSWIQQRVPRAMLGRAMSIFMFIFLGVAPLAAAVAGLLLSYLTPTQLFAGAGLFLLCAAALAYLLTPIKGIADIGAEA